MDDKVGKNLIIRTSTDVAGSDKMESPYRYIFVYRKTPASNFA